NTCICTEQWNDSIGDNLTKLIEYLDDPNQISCRRKSCYLDFDLRFRRGCLPVYDHNKCCPIDFICQKKWPYEYVEKIMDLNCVISRDENIRSDRNYIRLKTGLLNVSIVSVKFHRNSLV
ncbi:hypothetical protein SSS_04277, partial [Sarcoptes scabiei]